MGFFDQPPPRPAPVSPPTSDAGPIWPPWSRRPTGALGGFAAVTALVVRTDEALLAFDRFVAFPEGFEFAVSAWAPNWDHDSLPPWPLWHRSAAVLPANVIRLGINFADGRAATNLAGFPEFDALPAEGPVLMPIDEIGWPPHWEQEYWVGPMPPSGPVQLVVEWPARHIPETTVELDSEALRRAATDAERVWS